MGREREKERLERMQRSSVFGFVCVVALVAVAFLSMGSGAEASCSLVGRWRSFDNRQHYHINITFDFNADNTYQANATTADFSCKCALMETGVWHQQSSEKLTIQTKTCHASDCCTCEEEPLTYDLKYTSNCKVVFFILPDHGTIDFRRI